MEKSKLQYLPTAFILFAIWNYFEGTRVLGETAHTRETMLSVAFVVCIGTLLLSFFTG